MAKPKLIQQVREKIRKKNYSYRTEKAYVRWIVRVIKFCATRHPLFTLFQGWVTSKDAIAKEKYLNREWRNNT